MHQFFATLFSLLVALCHHTSLTTRPVEAAELTPIVETSAAPVTSVMTLPDRYQLARYGTAEANYAGDACASCRRMSGPTSDR